MAKRYRILAYAVRVIVCVALLAGAGAVYRLLVETKPEPGRNESMNAAPRVPVMAARAVAVRRQWEGFGTARAIDSADVPALVAATVVEIPRSIVDGAPIERGALIVQLDDRDFARQVETSTEAIADVDAQLARLVIEEKSWTERVTLAREQVDLARAEVERVREALARGASKQRELDVAQRLLNNAILDRTVTEEELDKLPSRRSSLVAQRAGQVARRRLAELNLERCRITSPLTGAIQSVDVEIGESVLVGRRVARVVDSRRIEVVLRLPASARESVRVGDAVEIRANGTGRGVRQAVVSRIAPEDDESTRTMGAYVEIEQVPDEPGGLAPGQFLRGVVTASSPEERWVVPRRSVRGDRIMLIEEGVIVSRPVDADYEVQGTFPALGAPDDLWVVLGGPLDRDALVVLNASRALPDGMRVRAVPVDGGARAARLPAAEAGK